MKTNTAFGLAVGLGTIVAIAVGVIAGNSPNATEKALRICKETGGKPLVTEYNSKTGLTINCFYEEFNNPTEQAEEFENL